MSVIDELIMRKLTFLFYLTFLIPNIVTGNLVEIYSLDQMDDPRLFCIDIRGHKSKAKTNSGLQAHTCYSYQGSIAVDQGFNLLKLDKGQFRLPAFDVYGSRLKYCVSIFATKQMPR